ncbi:SAM-dependent methyltransferase [Flavisolibacter ginsenosidimutans]|uniref:SAM-dependent methyltransferase n=1 Tax=Flavisolibacter ginsenosidimutans TaxID=661481 RepID=A0A5B8UFY9_9BACT|nr:SAM-dependent methyltransferase [Flavisolibacter ginsenosidimutans]QEC55010.1 SAM-dependent methyltransferase [Flavisolibacter ginsenosidimutans]
MNEDKPQRHPSSYRDPSGFVFTYQNQLYRQVNKCFSADFETFVRSGLYQSLVDQKFLIPHKVVPQNFTGDEAWFATLKPERIERISYPYEWSFSMLKDAALLTLQLALKALEKDMILKDASPYNVQFYKGRAVFIDTLSFENYKEGEPWIAYRQFCENFLAPLSLMHYVGLPLQGLFLAYPDGIPLLLAKKLLPFKSKLNALLYLHLHLHASLSAKEVKQERKTILSKQKLINLLKGLQSLVSSFRFDKYENVWGKYYEEAETRPGYLDEKKTVISSWLSNLADAKSVIDIGGNKGEFSLLAATPERTVICADGEHHAIERLYQQTKEQSITNVLPLCIDFTNPSPAIGVNNKERSSFFERASSDLAMALALVHHLAIGKNISFDLIAEMCAQLGKTLIIEFVTREDEKVQLLLRYKKDIYDWYTEENFQAAFSKHFKVIERRLLTTSSRILYLMKGL